MRRFEWLMLLVWAVALNLVSPVVADDIPEPPDPKAYHYIELPAGGLQGFMRWHPMRIPLISHHRGGPAPGFPENSIEAMQNALRYGPGLMEVDVAQLKDGTLILMHDGTIDRTTTGSGSIENLALADVKQLYLLDAEGNKTRFRVPTLAEVLEWTVGRAILTLDIKPSTDFASVVQAVKEARAEDYVVAICYSLEQAKTFHRLAPDMMLTVTMRNAEEVNSVLGSGIPKDRIVAWTGTRVLASDFYHSLHQQGWRVIVGTLGAPETSLDMQFARTGTDHQYLEIYQMGADIVATDRFWAVQRLIRNPNIFVFTRSNSYR